MMTKKYDRLSLKERIEIEKLVCNNKSCSDIATVAGLTFQQKAEKQFFINHRRL